MTLSFRRVLFSSLSGWILTTILGIYFLATLQGWINFGMDLVGGTYIRLDVEVEKAVENDLADRAHYLIEKLKKENSEAVVPAFHIKDMTAVITFASDEAAKNAEPIFTEVCRRNPRLKATIIHRQNDHVLLSLPLDVQKTIEHDAVVGNIAVLEARLNQFGLSEIHPTQHGERSIIVELPNVHNPQQAKDAIGRTALLEIKGVEDIATSKEELVERYGGQIPEGFVAVKDASRPTYYLVPAYTDLTGRYLKSVTPDVSRDNFKPVVTFSFNDEGSEKFYDLTAQAAKAGYQSPKNLIAMILDDMVITAAGVQRAITGESVVLSGSFTNEDAQEIAKLLKSGSFVAPVRFEEERTIGPSLGHESIRQGLIACIVGLSLLLLFSVLFYKVSGIFAAIVLFYNLCFILFALALFKATLTLPGIAGMILTIGMAIDASILIYERIKEELAKGVSFKQAVDTGFNGAMAVILDANITHLLVSLVLYKLGTGPIKGFAITMIIGIVSTLITGLVLLRAIFNFTLNVIGVKKISI